MEERQVTMDGKTYAFEGPFMVIATQNPIEYEGTFPLPEAQLDRFLMKISMGYPAREDEIKIVERMGTQTDLNKLSSVVTPEEVIEMQSAVKAVHADESVWAYIVDIVRKTRTSDEVVLGCSPRAAVGLLSAAKAHAYIKSRKFVLPEDVRDLATDVLAHRMIVKPEVRYKGRHARDIVGDILSIMKVPKVMAHDE
jgi:MoxR-like ATPase